MIKKSIQVKKSSGEKVDFSLDKLKASLHRSGAGENDVSHILNIVRDELYQGISTNEIYNRAFALLKKKKSVFASKYKLKKAIYEFGPTGFPFEKFIGQVLKHSGYDTEVGVLVDGKCVQHEVDVVASKENRTLYVECKFHGEEGRNCNVKVPLYIHARYRDIIAETKIKGALSTEGWVVTNTRFTKDAIEYGTCAGLTLLSWDYPKNNGLKDRIDSLGLYPITVSTLLTKREKNFLLGRDVVLCKQLLGDSFYLDHLGISETRKSKILKDIQFLCNVSE
ncbi:restriction endonuclease [uncultured Dokdonia sp.]|uniref:restriction endonuclease n=1 Tax=uncultured Dokdonia sp. TaxID=575653 RepID=UPI002602811D|nr:restriction endonuclease [uncultured Dokdonia sp.]